MSQLHRSLAIGLVTLFTLITSTNSAQASQLDSISSLLSSESILLDDESDHILGQVTPPPPTGDGDTYYISNAGNDSNSGLRESNAKQTLRAAEKLINNATPGDSILFRRGDTWSGTMMIKGVGGTAADRIVVGAYGSGAKPVISSPTNAMVVVIRSGNNGPSQYLTLRDIELTTSVAPAAGPGQGIFVGESWYPTEPHHITLDNLDVNSFSFGVHFRGASNMILENSNIHDNHNEGTNGDSSGFLIGGTDITIRNNVISNNGKQTMFRDHNGYLDKITNLVFENNEIFGGNGNIKVRGGENIILRDNHFHDLKTAAIGIGADGGSDLNGALIERNLIARTGDGITIFKQGGGGIDLIRSVVIRNNIFKDRDENAGGFPVYIPIGGTVENLTFEHNTFSNIKGEDLINITARLFKNIVFRNNIFSGVDSSVLSGTGVTMENNLYHNATVPGNETNEVSGTPDFVSSSDLHLTSSSDAINAGTGNLATDFEGNARDNSPDLGAYEYDGTAPPK